MNLGGIEAHWWWLLAAALLGIFELLVPGVFLAWMAAAAAVTGIAVLALGLPLPYQLALFALLAVAAVYSGRRHYDRHPVRSSDPMLNERTARLIGETVTVVRAIENGAGRVKVGDSVWTALGSDAAEGERVVVIGAEGSNLRVQRVAELRGPDGPAD